MYDTVEALLADDRIQVVHICTPNISHAGLTIQSLNAGKHVMCEKPMATNSADARAMLEAAKKNNRKLTIGYQGRFRREAMHLKKCAITGNWEKSILPARTPCAAGESQTGELT